MARRDVTTRPASAKPTNILAWPIRLNAPATFDVSVRYGAGGGTKLILQAGDRSVSGDAAVVDSKNNSVLRLGQLSLPAGQHELRFKPEKLGAVTLFDVTLKPMH